MMEGHGDRTDRLTWCLLVVQVHLDVRERRDVYYVYANYMISAGHSYTEEVISAKHFFKVWKREFPWLKTRQKQGIFNKCKVCEDLEVGADMMHHDNVGTRVV